MVTYKTLDFDKVKAWEGRPHLPNPTNQWMMYGKQQTKFKGWISTI